METLGGVSAGFSFCKKGTLRRDLSVSPNIGDKIQVRNFVKFHKKQKAK